MTGLELYNYVSNETSKFITHKYSTSFSLGIRTVNKKYRQPVYNLYGFVRLGDEIVDTFHHIDKKEELQAFRHETRKAVANKFSTNLILNSFQQTVNDYNIEPELYETFLDSMEMDLNPYHYSKQEYEKYILGSAEVVGLMVLRVFCENDEQKYQGLKPYAMKLGSAYQKINFLRDMQADYFALGRAYFPNVKIDEFNDTTKKEIEADIAKDFSEGLKGIKNLPFQARFGVYLTYVYYITLFKKIQTLNANVITKSRIRVPDFQKILLLISSYFRHRLNLIK